jgi:hypothetical protein
MLPPFASSQRAADAERQILTPLIVNRNTSDFRDPIGRQPPEPHLATALEDSVDGEVALEDEIAAVLNLIDRAEPTWIDGGALAALWRAPCSLRPWWTCACAPRCRRNCWAFFAG